MIVIIVTMVHDIVNINDNDNISYFYLFVYLSWILPRIFPPIVPFFCFAVLKGPRGRGNCATAARWSLGSDLNPWLMICSSMEVEISPSNNMAI